MPAATIKFLDSPLQFTDNTFEHLVVREKKQIGDVLKNVLDVCKEEIVAGGSDLLHKIPFLTENNLSTMQDGSLVRYRCMIQDMREPEYFLSLYSTIDGTKPGVERLHCNLWRETLDIPDGHEYFEDSSRQGTDERHVLIGGLNPAETKWVHQFHNSGDASSFSREKRQTAVGQCLIKVYHNGDQIKLNDVVEFIGIYYSPDTMSAMEQEKDDQTFGVSGINLTGTETNPQTSMPCLHIFYFEKLLHVHPDSTMPNKIGDDQLGRNFLIQTLRGDVPAFRSRLINAFKDNVFNGDELAAEYFLCHLISSVYARQITTAVGQFALNIFNVQSIILDSDWTTTKLHTLLQHLLTQVAYLPLSLSTLNNDLLASKKCYETERLISGRLQLTRGTELVIDETKLEVGQLNTQGVKNMDALRTMIKWQKLDYDFTFNTCEFSTDIRTLIVSDGPSILPSDFALPIRSSATSLQADAIFEDQDFVEAARVYFALTPSLTFTIEENMQNRIQEDFVVMRRDSNGEVTGDYLHRLLTLARMLSLSSGDSRLRQENWDKAKRMESERLQRLKK